MCIRFCFMKPGVTCTAWERATTEEKERLRCEKAKKHETCQEQGVPLSDGDNDDAGDAEVEGEDRVVLGALQGSNDAAGPSGAGYSVGASGGSAARKCSLSSSPRESSLNHPCAAASGGRGSLFAAPVDPSLGGVRSPSDGRTLRILRRRGSC